jgi:hypothetical protein
MTNFITLLVLTISFAINGRTHFYHHDSKTVSYEIALTQHPKTINLTKSDSAYFKKLMKLFKYNDSIIIYSLTDLKLKRDGKTYFNKVYQNTQDKSQYLVDLRQVNSDRYYLVVNTQYKRIGRPGTGGISYHPTESRKQILCLNGQGNSNGVPIDDGMKGGFPTPKFTTSRISWFYN